MWFLLAKSVGDRLEIVARTAPSGNIPAMTVTILTGLPGAGKSETLITRVNATRREGRTALTFMCSDSPTLRARSNLTELREMRCRSGLKAHLSHFVSSNRARELLAGAPAGALLAFDEALHFGDELVPSWCRAADRGAEILIASPSMSQVEALERRGHAATRLRLPCQRCKQGEASQFFLYLEDNRTESVCDDCYARLQGNAEKEIAGLLKSSDPRPGEERLSLPVELPQCRGWHVERDDSQQRLQQIIDACTKVGLPEAHSTYLDFGCRTGFFCSGMAAAGFNATGMDPSHGDIKAARMLSTYARRDAATYEILDSREHPSPGQGCSFDVITVFGISERHQWLDASREAQACLRKLFRQTKRIFIAEAPDYDSARPGISTRAPSGRAWQLDFMHSDGDFVRIERIEGKQQNLRHDLLLGYKV